ncbi:MAG: transposase, partial [Microcystaceae cyanobacterium]
MNSKNDDYDSPWKEVLTRYFPGFLDFYFPLAHRAIDWTQPHTFLDQELAQIVRDGEIGKRRIDRLVQLIEFVGAKVKFLPPYSPDLSPIELCWSKLKEIIRSA